MAVCSKEFRCMSVSGMSCLGSLRCREIKALNCAEMLLAFDSSDTGANTFVTGIKSLSTIFFAYSTIPAIPEWRGLRRVR